MALGLAICTVHTLRAGLGYVFVFTWLNYNIIFLFNKNATIFIKLYIYIYIYKFFIYIWPCVLITRGLGQTARDNSRVPPGSIFLKKYLKFIF
jgi:hypothetical protein